MEDLLEPAKLRWIAEHLGRELRSVDLLVLAQQLTEVQFRAAADAVIVNDGDRERTRERVRDAWARIREATEG